MNVIPTGKLAALVLFALVLGAGTVAVAAAPPADRLPKFARDVWAITELVAKHHPTPPARAAMLEAAARALGKGAAPADLKRRAEGVASADQLAALLKAVWPADEARPEALEAAALRALLGKVPGNPHLLTPSEARVNDQLSANRYVGIGIQIGSDKEAGRPVILDPFRRGTAYKAGAKPKDLIVKVNGKDTHGVPLMKVVDWLRGEEGTAVEVELRQPGAAESRTYTVTRAAVPFDTVFGYRVAADGWTYRIDKAHKVGYVRVASVTSSTLHELRQAERRLRAEGVSAVVLDLRHSQGGELHTAGLLAGSLLDKKLLWRIRDARGEAKETRSGDETLFRGWPLAVLVSAQMGHAAQAAVAALQDAGRAVVVGERTRFDGHVNSLLPVAEGGSTLVLLTGTLERPATERGWPVVPDHVVRLEEKEPHAVATWLGAKSRSDLAVGTDRPPADPQLAKAVEAIKPRREK